MVKLSITASTEEEFKELRDAYSELSKYFVFKTRPKETALNIKSTSNTVRTLDDKFQQLQGKGVEIRPSKDNILSVLNNGSNYDIPSYWFDSGPMGLVIGLKKEEEKKYLFEIYYQNKKE